eukprot:TRINITY_DN483_c0_g1_i12.p1 TRINITY_DN483_c0_g1~~TRINITY_DN483_c0_g1_i12.p1  ORF type:complete len:488 (-),score=139.67 TRINITY_DN483_c0_g1_i12:4-1365(-)
MMKIQNKDQDQFYMEYNNGSFRSQVLVRSQQRMGDAQNLNKGIHGGKVFAEFSKPQPQSLRSGLQKGSSSTVCASLSQQQKLQQIREDLQKNNPSVVGQLEESQQLSTIESNGEHIDKREGDQISENTSVTFGGGEEEERNGEDVDQGDNVVLDVNQGDRSIFDGGVNDKQDSEISLSTTDDVEKSKLQSQHEMNARHERTKFNKWLTDEVLLTETVDENCGKTEGTQKENKLEEPGTQAQMVNQEFLKEVVKEEEEEEEEIVDEHCGKTEGTQKESKLEEPSTQTQTVEGEFQEEVVEEAEEEEEEEEEATNEVQDYEDTEGTQKGSKLEEPSTQTQTVEGEFQEEVVEEAEEEEEEEEEEATNNEVQDYEDTEGTQKGSKLEEPSTQTQTVEGEFQEEVVEEAEEEEEEEEEEATNGRGGGGNQRGVRLRRYRRYVKRKQARGTQDLDLDG